MRMSRSVQCFRVVIVLRFATVAVVRSVDVALRLTAMITALCAYVLISVYCKIMLFFIFEKASRPFSIDCFSFLASEYF
jgi:hypothetical protein